MHPWQVGVPFNVTWLTDLKFSLFLRFVAQSKVELIKWIKCLNWTRNLDALFGTKQWRNGRTKFNHCNWLLLIRWLKYTLFCKQQIHKLLPYETQKLSKLKLKKRIDKKNIDRKKNENLFSKQIISFSFSSYNFNKTQWIWKYKRKLLLIIKQNQILAFKYENHWMNIWCFAYFHFILKCFLLVLYCISKSI